MLKKVVIIGAGPCGLLLAHYLLRRQQYQVEIYEGRPEKNLDNLTGNRTFSLSLQERGRKALREIPELEEKVIENGILCLSTISYSKNNKPRQINRKIPLLTIDRHRLVTILLETLRQNYSSKQVTINFGYQCYQINSQQKTVTLKSEKDESLTVNYDSLVGADGANSQVREYLSQFHHLQCEKSYINDAYKTIFLKRVNPEQKLELASDKIHGTGFRKSVRLLFVPQTDDRLDGVIIFPSNNNPLEPLENKEKILAFFQENFPPFHQLMTETEAENFLNRPVSRVLTVRCDRFHQGEDILLLGDAVHAVSPAIGQGCNSALEDVFVFNQLLDQYQDNWAQVLPSFSEKRIPDVHALQELSNYAFPRGNKWLATEFFFRLITSRWLHQWFPRWFKPFVLTLVMDTDIPYSQILNDHQGWINKVKGFSQSKLN